eukprot:TRINITY_DN6259_c0_g1_i1.p1 TRINITY_DN6259_c0_g1~~TRINITY_DN6259_c0_g1_i1.p1  ORF type:complete len:194 (-),score=42.09 TRINITY_DN6259_c0_g1_i1:551-1084(-)
MKKASGAADLDQDVFLQLLPFLWNKTRELFGFDKRSIALFRVVLALAAIFDLADRARDLHVHYTDEGIMPRSLVLSDFWNYDWISVYMVSGTVWVTVMLFGINTIINVFLLIGYYTKTSAILSYIFLVSLQDRNILVGHAGDVEHRIVAMFACLLPLADFWSVDAALKLRERGRKNK